MVGQYNSLLFYAPNGSAKPVKDEETGDWNAGEPAGELKQLNCRAEMNGNNRTLAMQDGSKLDYSFVIYLPKGTDVIEKDIVVEVMSGAEIIVKAPVKQFFKGQLNCKLYV